MVLTQRILGHRKAPIDTHVNRGDNIAVPPYIRLVIQPNVVQRLISYNVDTRFYLNKFNSYIQQKNSWVSFAINICTGFHQPPDLWNRMLIAFSQSLFFINFNFIKHYTPAGRSNYYNITLIALLSM
ncbi:hypothetical protein JBW_02142 [Pelosinus fermentans JBW45]|uniref:Uncharacterized protein n=1 Tax=Pelosinus fermentans JBW45 TaxID=1192197 RepID=I8U186_9FIRM|nr:hypothetical protein JBW_02142 [Pelosinus fermentans JBW45]